jgi:hypothetical protein
MSRLTLCCFGLTVYDVPKALEVADIVVVEETDFSPLMGLEEDASSKHWCRVFVKDTEAAKQINEKFGWKSQEKPGLRFDVAAYFEASLDQPAIVFILQGLLGQFKYQFI